MQNVKFALFLLVSLVPSLTLHEFAHATVADRLGDPSARRFGRLTLDPRPLIDPFGTVILPGLILVLVASGSFFVPPLFAYAKPMPFDPMYLHNRERDATLVHISGPVMNLALATAAGLLLRTGIGGDGGLLVYAFLYVNLLLLVFNLMPIPGLDGAKILARYLPPRPREVFMNLEQYLVLFMLVIFFLFGGPLIAIVRGLAGGVCTLLAGSGNC